MFYKAEAGGYRELLPGVHLKTLVYGEKSLLGHFRLETGAKIPTHDHPQEQTGYLISGRLAFVVDGEAILAEPGDSWCIPGGVPHSVDVIEEAYLVEIFSPVRESYLP
ncbi:MAG: cupin domain-containing protein [Anaerolineales bacterium]|nr:cupin domain-containing protein [Anaerolineales bacterium]